MVAVDVIQAQVLSAQAVAHLRANDPLLIPDPQLTQQFADAFTAAVASRVDPFLAQLRTQLDLKATASKLGGTRVLTITPKTIARNRRKVVGVFVHGGGWALLGPNDYNAHRMAHDLGIVVHSVDYDRSPKVRFPVALDQTAAACAGAAKKYDKVVVAGSSAGANMLVAGIIRAVAGAFDPPVAAGLFSPAADLRAIGDSCVGNDGRDPLLSRNTWTELITAYLGATPPDDPEASPILGDLSGGLVPTMINTGTRDLLLSDAVRLHRTMRDEGIDARLRVWEGMWHAFESVPGLPEGERAMAEVFGFLDGHL